MTIITTAARQAELDANGYNAAANNCLICYNNQLSNGTTSVTFTVTGATNVTDPDLAINGQTYDGWVATATATEVNLKIEFGANRQPDFWGIAAHNLGTLGATVYFEYSFDDILWAPIAIFTPTTNAAFGARDVGYATPRYRVSFTGLTIGDQIELGVLFIGKEQQVGTRILEGYAPPITPNAVTVNANVSAGGHILGTSVVSRNSRTSANMPLIFGGDIRSDEWIKTQSWVNDGKPFFWAWRPGEYGDLFWSVATAPMAPVHEGGRDFMTANLSMVHYHHE